MKRILCAHHHILTEHRCPLPEVKQVLDTFHRNWRSRATNKNFKFWRRFQWLDFFVFKSLNNRIHEMEHFVYICVYIDVYICRHVQHYSIFIILMEEIFGQITSGCFVGRKNHRPKNWCNGWISEPSTASRAGNRVFVFVGQMLRTLMPSFFFLLQPWKLLNECCWHGLYSGYISM